MKHAYTLWVILSVIAALAVLGALGMFLNRQTEPNSTPEPTDSPSAPPPVSPSPSDSPMSSPEQSATPLSINQKEAGKAAYAQGKYPKAISHFQLAIQATSDAKEQAELYNLIGNAYRDNKDTDNALNAYNQAITIDPTLIAAYTNMSTLYVSQNNKEKARVILSQGLKANPNNATLELELSSLNLSGTEGN